MNVAAIIPAAGKGKRLNSRTPKVFLNISGWPLVVHTLANLKRSYPFKQMIVAADPAQMKRLRGTLDRHGLSGVTLIAGGRTRGESVRNAVSAVKPENDWVLVHDAARPLVDRSLVAGVLKAARRTGAALCVMPAIATVKRIDFRRALVRGTEDRQNLALAQTPQVFKKKLLLERYRSMGRRALSATDEAALFDRSGVKVGIAAGRTSNIKVTTPEDVKLLKFYLKESR